MKQYLYSKYLLLLVNEIAGLVILAGCGTIKESSKYQFNEGFYRSNLFHKKKQLAYVEPQDDSIKVYYTKDKQRNIDTNYSIKLAFPGKSKPLKFESYTFTRSTFDIDVLSVLFKYRPAVKDFPNQFNTPLNGALYLGYRNDIYRLSYKKTPLQVFKRTITHYAYSLGIFSGIGTARIDEYVTLNAINMEYDGAVNLFGIAAILGVDKLTFGLTAGEDNLLDGNKKYWVNQLKPWFGISIGLNLN